jgi:hypothetical protein
LRSRYRGNIHIQTLQQNIKSTKRDDRTISALQSNTYTTVDQIAL